MFFLISIFLMSCSSDEGGEEVLDQPSNLVIEVVKNNQNPGLIGLNISAENANYFAVDFGAGEGFEESTDRSYTYIYEESGEYVITVRAHSTDELFIEESEEVIIDLPSSEIPTQGYSTPMSYSGFDLVWNDEFDGTQLSSDWTYEIGTGSNGWGNNELQYYTDDNTTVSDGFLIIEARKENVGGQNYTSSRIITENNQEFKFGRIDIRAVLPEGQGLWPALWMLGANFREVGWPNCGEIDIMEMIGGAGRENNVFGTLHWDNNGSYACTCGQGDGYTLSNGTFADEFHVFSLIWDATQIRWYVDDNLYHTIDISPADLEEFREEFFFIFNVAVGGNLPGDPNSSTQFPQRMIIDYVRVFQPN